MPSSFGLEAEREADQLGQVQHRQAEVAVHDLRGVRLLQVEVEVAERAGRDEASASASIASPMWRPAWRSEVCGSS